MALKEAKNRYAIQQTVLENTARLPRNEIGLRNVSYEFKWHFLSVLFGAGVLGPDARDHSCSVSSLLFCASVDGF